MKAFDDLMAQEAMNSAINMRNYVVNLVKNLANLIKCSDMGPEPGKLDE